MPFDSTEIQDRAELISTVSEIVETFDKAGKEEDAAKDKKSTACDDILNTFRIALNGYDIVPFMFWQDICDAHGYAYTKLDIMTGKASKIEGEKPHNTLKNVSSRIKKYYEKYGNLDATSYSELRDCLKPEPKTDYDIALDKLGKLSDTELRIIAEGILEGLNGTAEA
jgi:hypothetical protein